MEKSIVKRWVKALRSGKYQQARAILKDNDGSMCCLGVLCDITEKETGGEWNGNYFVKDNNNTLLCLPDFVCISLGIDNGGTLKKSYKTKQGQNTNWLSKLNDQGHSFKEIANIIEKNF